MKTFDLLVASLAEVPDEIQKKVDLSFEIVNRIHQILDQHGKTQKDLADALGKHESEVSKWMRGTHNFTIDTLSKISVALGENVISVIGTQNQNHPLIMVELKSDRYQVPRNSNTHLSLYENIRPMYSDYAEFKANKLDLNRKIN